ncbi:MAG: CHASE2 domain-containing protein [Fidelibacterota bacterium]
MPDIFKRILIGAGIGWGIGLLCGWGSANIPGLKALFDGYEYLSYDARMKSKVVGVEPESIDHVVIIDIENNSIASPDGGGLGRYQDWPHAYHGQLIDVVTNSVKLVWSPDTISSAIDYYQVFRRKSDDTTAELELLDDVAYDSTFTISGRSNWAGDEFFIQHVDVNGLTGPVFPIDTLMPIEPQSLLFDIIFDPQDTTQWRLVYDLAVTHWPADEWLSSRTQEYLLESDPAKFIKATRESKKTHHALVFETEDSASFLYRMETEPAGYDSSAWMRHIIFLPEEQARQLPPAARIGNTHFQLLSSSYGVGSINFPQDPDGVIRRAPTAIYFEGPGHVYPSITLSAAMDILDIPRDGVDYDFEEGLLRLTNRKGEVVREIPIDEQGRMYVNYYGTFKTFKYIEYVYCMNPQWLSPEYWDGKSAIVGSSLPGLMDLRNTPVQETFPGVEIHANVLQSILQGEFVSRTDSSTNLWIVVIMSVLLGGLVGLPPKPLWSLPMPIVVIGGWILFTYSQFMNHLLMWEIVRPSISLGVTYLGFFLYNFLVAEKDKRFLKNTFGTYISPELIEQMYKEKQEPQLGGEEGYHTAFFTDIQSFSTFSEKLSATDLVELLNEYLTEMTDILLANKGTLDKYIGDAIVAFYGAPAPVENHEYYACLTAVKMQERLAELRKEWASQGERWPEIVHHMQNRIGINSGHMVTGNMGSSMRMNYTMMGDTVNLAARLEASAKQYGIYVQVAEETQRACADRFIWRDLDYVIVMGKTEPARVFELIAEKGKMPDGYAELLKAFDEAVSLYRDQKWDQALEAFQTAAELEDMFPGRKTNPSRVYIPRCEHYKTNPPGDDWDGSWALTKK